MGQSFGSDDCGGVCLTLLVTEVVPPYVPTFVLWGVDPLASAWLWRSVSVDSCARMSANPVLALYLGGCEFSLSDPE